MCRTFALSADALAVFEARGVVRVQGFYPPNDIAPMAKAVWADLHTRYGMQRDRPESWRTALPAQFQALKRSGAFAAIGSQNLFDLADQLLGPGAWEKPKCWGGTLVTFPTPTPPLRRPPWHLDLSGDERLDALPTLRVFTFLESLAPHGGGTLYVSGSHRLAIAMAGRQEAPVRSAQVRERLKCEHPWFAALLNTATADLRSMIGQEAQVDGVTVSVEEMTGEVGDLILMHPAILHATAHNALDRPRMMLTEWIPRLADQPAGSSRR